MGRVQLAMLLVKTKTHGADLLMRANRHAVAALSHELRALPAAERLRHASPRPALAVRISRYTQGISHAAACLAVLLLTRMGVLTGMEKFRDESVQAVQRHYARHLDPDIVKQIV